MQKMIPGHEKPTWEFSDMFTDARRQAVCYYHALEQFLGIHRHKFYEINIVVEGSGTHFLDNQCCEAKEGSVFVIPPGVSHGYKVEQRLVIFHILLSELFFSIYREKLSELGGFAMLFEIEPYLRGRFSEEMFPVLREEERKRVFSRLAELVEIADSTYESCEQLLGIQVFSVIGSLCQSLWEKNRKTHRETFRTAPMEIVQSLEYIHENLTEKIHFEALAKQWNMAYATFLRQFKKVTKTTPLSYQNTLRMEKAKILLKNTNETVSYIAVECGFYDSSHFIRLFEKQTGLSPLAFREKNMKE